MENLEIKSIKRSESQLNVVSNKFISRKWTNNA